MIYVVIATLVQVILVAAMLVACVCAGTPDNDDSDHEYDKVPDFEEEE